MKALRPLTEAPPGVQDFLRRHPATTDWKIFSDYVEYENQQGHSAHHELLEALKAKQHGLCAYCEIDLSSFDHQIEHFLPKSEHKLLTYDPENLLAACMGGTNPHSPDVRRKALKPSRRSMSCGQFKDRGRTGCVPAPKPTKIPRKPRLVEVDDSGTIYAAVAACETSKWPAEQLTKTLNDCLNLNCERLRQARATVWTKLNEQLLSELARLGAPSDDDAFEEALRSLATDYLLPDDNGLLAPFFTTHRSFFGEIGELVLSESDRWI